MKRKITSVFKVTKIEQEVNNARIDAEEYEFECLSFNEEYPAINIIDSESECKELLPPTANIDAECPAQCDAVKSTETGLPPVGFFDCKCDEEVRNYFELDLIFIKCSYACANDTYEAVFPEGWNQEEDDDVYISYKCIEKEIVEEKDNLVMIICTSIFVPLGVAGIAAGVYFFFFHEFVYSLKQP